MRYLLAPLVALALVAALPSIASADVLITAPKKYVTCGNDISVGVWYQSYSGGSRYLRIAIRRITGYTVARRTVRATTTWEKYWYTPKCGRRYTVVFTGAGWKARYPVRVGS